MRLSWKAALPIIVAAFALPCLAAGVQGYPEKPIRIVVPFAPGGGGDFIARAWSDKFSAAIGQSVIIENRGGGNTVAGTDVVAKAAPDGYTLLLVSPSFVTNPTLVPGLPYRTPQDFAPVAEVISYAMGLAARTALPVQNIPQLIDLARKNPGKISVATSGEGSATQMATKLFEAAAGVELLDVSYRGAGPAMLDVAGGTVDLAFTGLSQVRPHLQSERVRLLATTGARRLQSAPNVPTVAEQGLKNFEAEVWWGVLAPAGTPKEIIAKINAALKTSLADPAVARRLEVIDGEVKVSTPEAFAKLIDEELVRWNKLLKPTK